MKSKYYQPYFGSIQHETKAFKSKFQFINFGKENKEGILEDDRLSIIDHKKRLFQKSREQFKLQKLKVKELYNRLKTFILPERQNFLAKLVISHKQFLNEKAIMKDQHSRSIELQGQFSQLQKEKEKQEKGLSQLVDKNLDIFAQIQQNSQRQYMISVKNKQIEQQIRQKQNQLSQLKDYQKRDLQDLNLQLHCHNKMPLKNESLSTKNDSKIETTKKFMENAKLHQEELKNCLSSRLQYLIQLRQTTREKEAQLISLNEENSLIQASNMLKVEEQKLQTLEELQKQELKFSSDEMENIELQARLEILSHSLHDQINQARFFQKNIEDQQNFVKNSHSADKQTQNLLQKLIAIKLESQYLESRLKLKVNSEEKPYNTKIRI